MSSVIAIAKKKSKSNDNVAHFAAPASSGIVQGDLPASKKFQGDLPADIKAQILKIAFSDRPTLKNLQSTACRLALVLCKEDMKKCLQMFVPQSLGFVTLAAPNKFPLHRRVDTLHPISEKRIRQQMEFDVVKFLSSDEFLSSEHWQAEETPPIRVASGKRGIYLVPRWVDYDSFGMQCVNVLTKLYPGLTFAYERSQHPRGFDYIHVLCDGIRCNIPISVRSKSVQPPQALSASNPF